MTLIPILVLLALTQTSLQDISDNNIEDSNPLAEAAAEILKEQNLQNIGGALSNLMQSDGAKQLGDMLSQATGNEGAGQLLQGLGSVLGQGGKGLDPNLLGTFLDMFQSDKKNSDGYDPSMLLDIMGNFMGQGEGKPDLWSLLPTLLQTASAFTGPEAEARERAHKGHADLLPPNLERFHVIFDHFLNSALAKKIISVIGAEKWVNVFADENGKITYRKFVDMLENHSFRKHWLRTVTDRIASVLSHLSEPKTLTKYLITVQHFLNSLLKGQSFPKSALFDYTRPTESITALVNYAAKVYFGTPISSKQYVKPAVEYVQDIFKQAERQGLMKQDSEQLSNKLADTINLEVIEPIVRVNRAYRFALKVPECDRYVMCIVNQEPEDQGRPSLPGLRPLLSKSTSFVLSWFLSSYTRTPFWSFYRTIMGDENCQMRYSDRCNDFHLEEIRVKREIVHSEL